MTSVKLSERDMALLERVADTEGSTFAETWRRALHVYARSIGVPDDLDGHGLGAPEEVSRAA